MAKEIRNCVCMCPLYARAHGTCRINLEEKKIVAEDVRAKKTEEFTFAQLKKMKKRLEQASYMVALSFLAILLRSQARALKK